MNTKLSSSMFLVDSQNIKILSIHLFHLFFFCINFGFQIFLLGIILLPIRALLVALIVLLAWPFAALSTACCPEKLTHPITGWRR